VALDPCRVDVDPEARAVGYFHMPALDANGACGHIVAEALVGQREPPGDLRQRRSDMGGCRTGDAGFASLGGYIDVEPEALAQPAGRHHAAQAAELDGLEAHPARG